MRFKVTRFSAICFLLSMILISSAFSQTIPKRPAILKALALQDKSGNSFYPSFSQNRNSTDPGSFILTQLWDDLTYLVNERDFYYIVGGLGLAPGLTGDHFKAESPEFTELWGASRFADNFFEAGEIGGNAVFPVATAVLTYSIGYFNDSNRLKEFGSDLFRAHAMNGLLTGVIKFSVNRSRPDGGPHSYPSGHTSTAFTTAAVLHKHLGKFVGVPAFVVASYIGLSRLQENRHYFSDVVAGAVLGTYVGMKIANQTGGERRLRLSPTMIHGSPGAKISLRF